MPSAKVVPFERKKFDKGLYEKYHNHGVQVACHFLSQSGYEIVDTRDVAYGSHDFIVSKDGVQYKVEVEVTEKWKTLAFPYPMMSVPYKKVKNSQADLYVRTNPSGNALFFMPMKDIAEKGEVICKNTIYTTNEPFYNVDVSTLTLYTLQDGEWGYDD